MSYLWLALVPAIATAQQLSLGVIGGFPAQLPLRDGASKMPFVLGPTLSVGIRGPVSIETGVLFHRFGTKEHSYAGPLAVGGFREGVMEWKARALEIPILIKYRFLAESRSWRPFLTAGPTIRRTSIDYLNFSSTFGDNLMGVGTSNLLTSETVKWNVDAAAGAGISIRVGRFHVEPEARYSYWNVGKHEVVRKNQVHFLFGLRF